MAAGPDVTDFPSNTYDAAVFVLGFHELYYAAEGRLAVDAGSFMSAIYASVKSGGVIGIVEHAATLEVSVEVANTLHRIDPLIIHYDLVQAGFIFEGNLMC
ncbi:MAG: putative methyltransferase [Pseudohongiellaceae bacterium]|jgi:predicted methyltransferase